MWEDMRQWLKKGGTYAACKDPEVMRQQLTSPEIVERMDGKLQMESKKDMRTRIGPEASPALPALEREIRRESWPEAEDAVRRIREGASSTGAGR